MTGPLSVSIFMCVTHRGGELVFESLAVTYGETLLKDVSDLSPIAFAPLTALTSPSDAISQQQTQVD